MCSSDLRQPPPLPPPSPPTPARVGGDKRSVGRAGGWAGAAPDAQRAGQTMAKVVANGGAADMVAGGSNGSSSGSSSSSAGKTGAGGNLKAPAVALELGPADDATVAIIGTCGRHTDCGLGGGGEGQSRVEKRRRCA